MACVTTTTADFSGYVEACPSTRRLLDGNRSARSAAHICASQATTAAWLTSRVTQAAACRRDAASARATAGLTVSTWTAGLARYLATATTKHAAARTTSATVIVLVAIRMCRADAWREPARGRGSARGRDGGLAAGVLLAGGPGAGPGRGGGGGGA